MPTELGEFFSTPTGQNILACLARSADAQERIANELSAMAAQVQTNQAAQTIKIVESQKIFDQVARSVIPLFNTLQQLLNLGLGTGVIPARLWFRVMGSFSHEPKVEERVPLSDRDIYDAMMQGDTWRSYLK